MPRTRSNRPRSAINGCAAVGVLVGARRSLYRILADHPGDEGEAEGREEES